MEGKMKYKLFLNRHSNKFGLFKLLLSVPFILFFFLSCSSSKQELRVSGYRFTYDGNKYFIRSIYCPNSPQSCNHLIGENFEAVDLDQDRVIDKIVKGNQTILGAQKIYDYALNMLEKENKLGIVEKNEERFKYTLERPYLVFQIISFQPEKGEPFNQFKIIQKRSELQQDASVFNDLKANGSLDEKLKGIFSLADAQKYYKETINEGVRAHRISIIDSLIRVGDF